MGEVLGFTQKAKDDFSIVEKTFHERYSKVGIPADVITEALAEYRPIHERLFKREAYSIDLPAGLTVEQADAIVESVRSAVLPQLGYAARVIFELMIRQILNDREPC